MRLQSSIGSTSCDGNGRTDRSTSGPDRPSRAARKNRVRSHSLDFSVSGDHEHGRVRDAATADNIALAADVRPETRRVDDAPIPVLTAADFRTARSVSELDVGRHSRALVVWREPSILLQAVTAELRGFDGPGGRVHCNSRSSSC